jgi:NADH:ubiquinone oxidoreductase subunit 6 (subunit J)
MMIYIPVLVITALIIIASVLVFLLRDVLHVAVFLTIVFLLNSLLFLELQQTILALIQLFIMVGGVSIYLFVGVASASYSKFRYTNKIPLVVVSLALFSVMAYGAYSNSPGGFSGSQINSTVNVYSSSQLVSSFSSSYTIVSLYTVVIMLSLLALGAILLLNKLKAM